MADSKITALTALTAADPANDMIPIVDVSDTPPASGNTKRISINNILACSPSATLASATITGDLTVRTNKLAVTSTGVGIGTTTPNASYILDLTTAYDARARQWIADSSFIGSGNLANGFTIRTISGTTDGIRFLNYAQSTEFMRIDSTGLGVGGSPAAKISCAGYSSANQLPDINIARSSSGTAIQTGPNIVFTDGTSNNTVTLQNSQGRFGIWNYGAGAWNERLSVDSSGNVGIGVTPSAWLSSLTALQVKGVSGLYGAGSSEFGAVPNCFYYASSQWIYGTTAAAGRYAISSGVHQWFTAPSGTAGNAITFTQAMTLDASGNLLVAGTSAYIRAGGRTQIVGGSVVDINTVGNNVGIAFGGASSILPCDGSSTTTDGVANFGSASKRWNTIYASTGTINTSDQNEKQDIADLGDAEKRVAGKIKSLVKKYRFKDAVASKGENARIHVGWIAQDVQNAFSSEGLDASKYGVFCSDTWEENGVQKTRLGLRYDEVIAFVVSAI